MSYNKTLLSFIVSACIVFHAAAAEDLFDFDLGGDIDFETFDIDKINADVNSSYVFDLRSTSAFIAGNQFFSKIEKPLWNSTAAPAGRDALYLMPDKFSALERGGFISNFFFNSTDKMKVTTKDLFQFPEGGDFYNTITALLPEGLSPADAAQLLPLMKKITLQERKLGVQLQGGLILGAFNFQVHTSVQLAARNFWLNLKDQRQVKRFFKNKFGSDVNLNEREFFLVHTGLGDTRLKIAMNTINALTFQNDVGAEFIIPTSVFSSRKKVDIGLPEATFDTDKDIEQGVRNLKSIRNFLLKPHLGNGGHYGIGCFVESKLSIFNDAITLFSRLSHDILFKNNREMLFLFNQTVAPSVFTAGGEFQQPRPGGRPDQDAVNKRIANQFIRENIFPSSFVAEVYPGSVTNFVLKGTCRFKKHISGTLGYDFYAQNTTKIKSLKNTHVDISQLDLKKAVNNTFVLQHKIFSEVMFHDKKKSSDTGYGVGGDMTVASKGIGEDWTLYFKIATSF